LIIFWWSRPAARSSPLLLLGCYHGALEQAETGEGPLFGDGLDGNEPPSEGRELRLRR
jgi:hypothetical protein